MPMYQKIDSQAIFPLCHNRFTEIPFHVAENLTAMGGGHPSFWDGGWRGWSF